MEARSYDAFIYRQNHLKFVYMTVALAFVCYPLGTYLYIKFNLQPYKFLFFLAGLFFASSLLLFLRLMKGTVTVDGQRLNYNKNIFHFPRFESESGLLQIDRINKIELIKGRYSYYSFTITSAYNYNVYFAASSKDATAFVQWLNVVPNNLIIEKAPSEAGSFKIGFSIIGLIILDIILVFMAIFLAT
jgi:hypothetical protein